MIPNSSARLRIRRNGFNLWDGDGWNWCEDGCFNHACNPFAFATKKFQDFDDARMVRAVSSATAEEFKVLTATAELWAETSFMAKDAAEGMISLARIGFANADQRHDWGGFEFSQSHGDGFGLPPKLRLTICAFSISRFRG